MTEISTAPLADTSDMPGLHRVFREAFGSAVALVGSCDPADADRVELVAGYYDNVLRLLHVHHEGEDELLTPRLAQRATPDEVAEVERVAAQHQSVLAALAGAEDQLAHWRAEPSLSSATELATALVTLNVDLCAHLDDEERTVLPIAGRYISAPEWGELPAHGMRSFDGDKLWLILGLIREQMTPGQLIQMDAHMPPPLAAMWAGSGRPMFEEYVAALRS